MKDYHRAVLEITAAAVLVGLIPIIVKVSTLDFYTLALGRVFFAALSLLVGATLSRWVKSEEITLCSFRENWLHLSLFGIFHALAIIFYFITIKLTTAAVAALLLYLGTVYLVPLSRIFLKEPIERKTLLSLAPSFSGLLLILNPGQWGSNWWGYLAGIFTGLSVALIFLLGKIITEKCKGFSMAFYQNVIALPVVLVALPLVLPLISFSSLTVANIFWLIFLGVFCTAVAFILLYSGMQKIRVLKVGILYLLSVFFSVLFAFALLKESLEIHEWIGAVLIIIGSVLIILFHEEETPE